MSKADETKCSRCGVSVFTARMYDPARCIDPHCPLKEPEPPKSFSGSAAVSMVIIGAIMIIVSGVATAISDFVKAVQ